LKHAVDEVKVNGIGIGDPVARTEASRSVRRRISDLPQEDEDSEGQLEPSSCVTSQVFLGRLKPFSDHCPAQTCR